MNETLTMEQIADISENIDYHERKCADCVNFTGCWNCISAPKINEVKALVAYIDTLQSEVVALREALEFYTDPGNMLDRRSN